MQGCGVTTGTLQSVSRIEEAAGTWVTLGDHGNRGDHGNAWGQQELQGVTRTEGTTESLGIRGGEPRSLTVVARKDMETPGIAWDLARGQGNSGIVPGRDNGGSPVARLASGLSAVGTWVRSSIS